MWVFGHLTAISSPGALEAYEALAPHYDLLTAGYDYGRWIKRLDRLLVEHNRPGQRLLDVGCGTGHAIGPLRQLGYEVTACDLAPAMVAHARVIHPDVETMVADMRALPAIGPFDVALCLDDTVNYLLDGDELRAAFRSVRSVMARAGLFTFDANTPVTYETTFARARVAEDDRRLLVWRGHGRDEQAPLARATVEIFERAAVDALWHHTRSDHVQRCWSDQELRHALAAADFALLAVLGQSTGATLEPCPDPTRHTKFLYIARRS